MRRRRRRSPALWAMALILGLPALADAQLFPRLPLHKRHRIPCELEPPAYGVYRQQYYGYFPTCWRRFPPGWGCPSPEAPNVPALMNELKDVKPFVPEDLPGMEPLGPEGGPAAPNPDEEMPGLPSGPSPFDLPPADSRPSTDVAPLPDAGAPRLPDANSPRGDRSPAPGVPVEPDRDRERRPLLPPTAENEPAAPSPLTLAEGEPADATPPPLALPAEADHLPPEAAISDEAAPPTEATAPRPAAIPLPSLPVGPGAMAPAPPVRAPQRRSLLSGLFSNLGRVRK